MLEYDFDMSMGYWVCSTAHAIRKFLGVQLAQEKITLRQFEVLACLAKLPGCGSQTEIADQLGIEPHTLAGVLKRMERDGLLERTACNQDRRKNKVKPTEKAEEMWQRATVLSRFMRGELMQGFTSDELVMLREFCNRIQANIEAASDKSIEKNVQAAPNSPTSIPVSIPPAVHHLS